MHRETNHSRFACAEDSTTHFNLRPTHDSISYFAKNEITLYISFNISRRTSTIYLSLNERLFEV